MTTRREWLSGRDWETFMQLYEKVEGTNWYDTREVALGILSRFSPQCELEARNRKENITTILMVISMAIGKKIHPTHAKEAALK